MYRITTLFRPTRQGREGHCLLSDKKGPNIFFLIILPSKIEPSILQVLQWTPLFDASDINLVYYFSIVSYHIFIKCVLGNCLDVENKEKSEKTVKIGLAQSFVGKHESRKEKETKIRSKHI